MVTQTGQERGRQTLTRSGALISPRLLDLLFSLPSALFHPETDEYYLSGSLFTCSHLILQTTSFRRVMETEQVWPLAMRALVLILVGICRTGACGAPSESCSLCLGGPPGSVPILPSQRVACWRVSISKAAEQTDNQSLGAADCPLGQLPLEVPQDAPSSGGPGTLQPGECVFFPRWRAESLQGWGMCQKPSGQVDRCVSSICLAPGAWQMGRGDQAAENLDQFQTAPFPRLKAEHFRRAATEAAAPEGPSQKGSTGALQKPGFVGSGNRGSE